MSLSTQQALMLARTSIEATRDAGGAKKEVIKHYRTAKEVLTKIDVADTTALREVIAAFQDLAAILDSSGVHSERRASKCRQRANALQ